MRYIDTGTPPGERLSVNAILSERDGGWILWRRATDRSGWIGSWYATRDEAAPCGPADADGSKP